MERELFNKYRDDFEALVVVKAVKDGELGTVRAIPVRNGRLSRKQFGALMGTTVQSDVALAVDYYGLLKKSKGCSALIAEIRNDYKGKQVKAVRVPVVHFAQIKLELIAMLSPGMVADFAEFKKTVLNARGFKYNYQKKKEAVE